MLRFLRSHLTRRSALILLGLVGLAVGIDFVFFSGLLASDDIGYLEGVRGIAGDGPWRPHLATVRLGITLPGALVWWISGGSVAAVVWFHVVYHLALIPLAYVLGRLLLDERAGLIAAALVAINPLLYAYAGAVLPDNAATCWLGGAMIALVATKRYADPGTGLRSWNGRRFLGYFLAGAMIGACYTCKETALILTVPAAVFIMTAGPSFRSLVWIQNGAILTLGLVAVMALELLVLRGLTGEWVNRLTLVTDAADIFVADMERQGTTPFARLGYASDQVTRWMPLTTWLLIAGTVAYGFTRARSVGIMLFFWWPAIYLTIGSTSFTKYLPPTIQGRYYALVILPACVMAAVVTSLLIDRWRARNPRAWTRLALVCGMSTIGVYECGKNLSSSGAIYGATTVRAFAAGLELARERYPMHPILVSPDYGARMWPLLEHRPEIAIDDPRTKRPGVPYVYVKVAGVGDMPAPDEVEPPLVRVESITKVQVPRTRWNLIAHRLRELFSVTPPAMRAQNRKRWVEVVLVRPPPDEPKSESNHEE